MTLYVRIPSNARLIYFPLLVNSLFLKFPSEKLCSSYKQKCVSSVFVYLWALSLGHFGLPIGLI